MNILCTICARKGSKGLKNKNFLKINKKLLIEYSLETAIKSNIFKTISVSSDFEFSKKFKKKYRNVFFYKRPFLLSGDKIGKVHVIRDLFVKTEKHNKLNYDYIIDLDVTSPLRTVSDIKKALNKMLKSKKLNLITVTHAKKNPYFNMIEVKNNISRLVKTNNKQILTRQDAPKIYEMNASIYIWKRNFLMSSDKVITNNTEYFIMSRDKSIDIDDKFDFLIVKNILEKKFK